MQRAAAEALNGSEDESLLLQAASGLSAACAMELRAMLLLAQDQQRTQSMRSALNDIRESTITMRTAGALLTPRLAPASVEQDLADVMLTQGGNVSLLSRELEAALAPPAASSLVRPGTGTCWSWSRCAVTLLSY